MKKCTLCEQLKPLGYFAKNKRSRDGHQYYCRECKKRTRKWKPDRKYISTIVNNKKLCRLCNNWHDISNFHKCRANNDGLRNYCKICHRAEEMVARCRRDDKECIGLSELLVELHAAPKVCHYCGEKADSTDRRDNTKGYTPENMVPACYRCNTIKGCWLTEEQMKIVAKMFFIKDNI